MDLVLADCGTGQGVRGDDEVVDELVDRFTEGPLLTSQRVLGGENHHFLTDPGEGFTDEVDETLEVGVVQKEDDDPNPVLVRVFGDVLRDS